MPMLIDGQTNGQTANRHRTETYSNTSVDLKVTTELILKKWHPTHHGTRVYAGNEFLQSAQKSILGLKLFIAYC